MSTLPVREAPSARVFAAILFLCLWVVLVGQRILRLEGVAPAATTTRHPDPVT
jgi:hypothetical protein